MNNNVYVAGSQEIIKVGADNTREVLIDGFAQCVNVTVVGELLYVFDCELGERLSLLTYDLDGNKVDEKEVNIDQNLEYSPTVFVFQNIPFAYIATRENAESVPCLYNLETGETIQIQLEKGYESLIPMADGKIIGYAEGTYKQLDLLTIDITGQISIAPAPASYSAATLGGFAHDMVTGKDYALDADKNVMCLNNEQDTTATARVGVLPSGTIGVRYLCLNQVYYVLLVDMGAQEVTVLATGLSEPSENGRELRILDVRGGDRPIDFVNYVNDFQKQYPDITITFVQPPSAEEPLSVYYLQLMSGELDVDIISEIDPFYYDTGLYKDLSAFPEIENALRNPNLLEGVRENCLDPAGAVYGVPYKAQYLGYYVNEPLFTGLGLPLPSPDWTYDDYYMLAKQMAERNERTDDKVYVSGTFKSTRYRLDTGLSMVGAVVAMGANSSNGYALRIDTPDMIHYVERAREMYELFPYIDDDAPLNRYRPDALLIPTELFYQYATPAEELHALPIVPYPMDIYGNGTKPFVKYLGIYSKAKNVDEAVLFLSGYLDENYHRSNATEIQLFKDMSLYEKMCDLPVAYEDLMVSATKHTAKQIFLSDILWFYITTEERYLAGEITIEEFVQELQRGVEQRING